MLSILVAATVWISPPVDSEERACEQGTSQADGDTCDAASD